MSGVDAQKLIAAPVRGGSDATTASPWVARGPFVAAVALVGIAGALIPRTLVGATSLPSPETLLMAVLVVGGLLLVPSAGVAGPSCQIRR